jgi:hypothetical protein
MRHLHYFNDGNQFQSEKPIVNGRGVRKRAKPEKWIKDIKRSIRNSKEVRPPLRIACTHVDREFCSANQLTHEDVEGKEI